MWTEGRLHCVCWSPFQQSHFTDSHTTCYIWVTLTPFISLHQWFLTEVILPSAPGITGNDSGPFWLSRSGWELLMASRKQSSWMLLSAFQGLGWFPQQRITQPQMSILLRLKNPDVCSQFSNSQCFFPQARSSHYLLCALVEPCWGIFWLKCM